MSSVRVIRGTQPQGCTELNLQWDCCTCHSTCPESEYLLLCVTYTCLQQQIQSASSIWEFEYSGFHSCQPWEQMASRPNFLAMIEDYRCINLSANGKQLKPATDLATLDQQQNLAYVLDVFPGLYCERISPAGSQPRTTVNKPVLIVGFLTGAAQNHTEPLDPNMMMGEEANIRLPATLESCCLANNEYREEYDGQAVLSADPRFHGTADPGNTTTNNSRNVESPQTYPQQSLHHKEAISSRGGPRGSRQPQPTHPAPRGESLFVMIKNKMWQ